MQTLSPPSDPWSGPVQPPGRYVPARPQGKRILGWEDVNVSLLAADVGVSFRHLLGALRGERNCTLSLLQRTAQLLGIDVADLIRRMERSYRLNQQAAAARPSATERRERRRQRAGQAALITRG